MSFEKADLETRVENMLKIATVHQIDAKNHQIKVQSGRLISDWLPHPAQIGHNFRAWLPVRVGMQVLVASPSGDFAQAVVVQTLYRDDLPPPFSDLSTDIIQFNDGTTIKKDRSVLEIKTPCSVHLSSPTTKLTTNISIIGDFSATGGSFTHNNKNVGSDHKHKGVVSGKSNTKDPI